MQDRVLLVYGSQWWLVRREAKHFSQRVLGDAPVDFALQQFDMGELLMGQRGMGEGVEKLEAALRNRPLLCECYLVRLDGVERLKASGAGSEVGRGVLQVLGEVWGNMPAGLHVLLTGRATGEGELSKPLLREVRKRGVGRVVRHTTYDDWDGVSWVMKQGEEQGLGMGRPEAELLIRLVGKDMERLVHELEKLALVSTEAGVDESLVFKSVGGEKEVALFAITDHLARRNLLAALKELNPLLMEGRGQGLVLVAVLVRFFRQVRLAMDVGRLDAPERAKRLGLPVFFLRRLEAQARQFEAVEAERALRVLSQLELEIKRTPAVAPALFREFFLQVCQGHLKTTDPPLLRHAFMT